MSWIMWIIFAFMAIRIMVALSNLVSRQWLREGYTRQTPLVSVLVPARNEEKNLALLLDSLLGQDYPKLEILIYDDLSEDKTWEIISGYSMKHPAVKGIRGKELPQGWLGKNHACHQLSLQARGDYLLFLDADVIPSPYLIRSSVAYSQKRQLNLLSLFPSQIMNTAGEKITVPIMNWVLLSLLPLTLTRRASNPAFSAANGQFMFFKADTYHKNRFHLLERKQKAEDIRIARLMKKRGYRIQTLLGGNMIYCRMYNSFSASLNGFSKNILDFFGGSLWAGPVFMIITTLGLIPVWIAGGLPAVMAYLLMAMSLRLIISLTSRQPAGQNLLLWPLQHGTFIWLMIKAMKNRILQTNTWKGRNIDNL